MDGGARQRHMCNVSEKGKYNKKFELTFSLKQHMATALPQFPAFDISGPAIGLRWEKCMAVTFQTAADYQQNNGTNRQASLAVTFCRRISQ